MKSWYFYSALGAACAVAVIFLFLYIFSLHRRRNVRKRMQELLLAQEAETDRRDSIYERLFPQRLKELLGIGKIEEISDAQTRSFPASIMSVNTLDYDRAVRTMSAEELFDSMNKIFAQIIPVIVQSGGVIDKFENSGMTGFYENSNEKVLAAAVTLCDVVDHMDTKENCEKLAIGLDYGDIMLGVAGCKERIGAVFMSENINISIELRNRASALGARILTTEAFAEGITDFKKNYNSRFIGYFFDTAREHMIGIYDIYDGDLPERKYAKRRTKMIFEQGVELFAHGSPREARLYFVEVLKADRYDLAARQYLYLCDSYADEPTEPVKLCLDRL